MKKQNIIKNSIEINNIIKKQNKVKSKYYYIYKDENKIGNHRFAICVSKKIGNAVKRNKIKRQIKDIIDKSNLIFKSNKDYVIIVSKEINNICYDEMKTDLIKLISKNLD